MTAGHLKFTPNNHIKTRKEDNIKFVEGYVLKI